MAQLAARHFAAFPIFMAFPTWFFLAEFPANIPTAGIGVTLSGVVMLALGASCEGQRGGALLFVVQVVFTALAMSLYQSFATLIAVGGLGVITSQAILRPAGAGRLVHEVATFAAAVVAGGALYLLAEAVFQHDLRIRSTAYLDNFLSPATFIAHPFGVTALALSEARSVYGGDRDIYGLFAWSFLLIPVPGIVALILTPHLRDRLVTRSMVLALAVAILVLPFAQNLLSGGLMPYRSLIAVPVAVWFLAFAGLEQGGIIVRRVAHTILAFASLQILVIFAQFQAADALAWQHDLRLAEAIYTRITEVRAAADAAGQSKVDFFGAPPALRTPYPRVETVGAPVFEWDGGNPYRIAALYRVLGYRGIVAVTPSERARLMPQFAAMPAWPAPDAVPHGW